MTALAQFLPALISALIVVAPAVLSVGRAFGAFLPRPRITHPTTGRRKTAPSTCENTRTHTPRRTA